MKFRLQQFGGVEAGGWSIDTRTLKPGDVFFALRGPNHDGNAHIAEAWAKGAVAVFPDGLQALQETAAAARLSWGGDVVGVTGSAGKTSTKDAIAALLGTAMPVGKTEGNFNNHIGVPLSILRLPDAARVAVLEMGMNHAGEIRELAKIARPQVGVVTMVGTAHIEFFDSIEGIALAKRELIEALPADGTAVLNADDERVLKFREVHPGPVITFGLSEGADVRAVEIEDGAFRVDGVRFETQLTGRHSIRNILSGIAVARHYGIEPESLREAVAALAPSKMRGERLRVNGIEILNDCYNSSPDAAKAMLDALRDTPARRRIAVLGEMLELGRMSAELHREVGRYVAASGIDVLIGVRGMACEIVAAAGGEGRFFEDPAAAGIYLREFAQPGDAILMKGSRGTHVERALEAFLAGERQPEAQLT